jgi:hypothetical protein
MLAMKEDAPMIRKIQVATVFAALVLAVGIAHPETPAPANLDHAQLKEMMRSAHSAEQYQTLASYYRSKQHDFEQKAQAEKVEWDRRSQNAGGPAAKYPRPADSSRNRYEYFTYEAQQMNQQATHYETLSASAGAK